MDTKKVAFLVAAEGIEQIELTSPWAAMEEAGYTPKLLSPKSGTVQAVNHHEPADVFDVDAKVGDESVDDYAGLVIPGGVINPDYLRRDEKAVAFVRDMVAAGKPVAAICHGPWMLVEADVLRGRTVTSAPSVRTDLRNAGAEVVDKSVVVDDNVITSRGPDDLGDFNAAIVTALGGPVR